MIKQTYIEQILGMADAGKFLIIYGFSVLGVIFSLLLHVNNRDQFSDATPALFSWKFFFIDNLQRLGFTLMLLFFGIRFSSYLFGQDVSEWLGFLIGLCLDKVSQIFKNLTLEARK
ncbi:hypothetical protein ACFS5N_16220 [Mucilaginibacter ximonensis]|uniref:Uncharacterized protein n=1 Tax=Mucilaginibacter ximonensis TaxID=538021 RepID=A0ABW5YFL7_9SPHI